MIWIYPPPRIALADKGLGRGFLILKKLCHPGGDDFILVGR